ncbi:MAG: cysteine desulfurase [Clostridia bacterium]|nr:cysteine desulfurase [Clostridia bacterium]
MTTNRSIYLDNSATTPLSSAAKEAMIAVLDHYGNPSSLHSAGQEAEAILEKAREEILRGLGLRPRQKDGILVFTSCGTEATSLALFGTAYAKERREANRILTTNSEHPSIARVLECLEKDGFEIIRIPTVGGIPDMEVLRASLDKKIFLATFMLVNNETGALYPVGEMFRTVKRVYPDAITHCDAVQGFMKVPFTPATLSADLVTVSAHKLHAPKGVGALYIAASLIKAKKIVPFLRGGGQEQGLRSGTENVPGIAAFGASVADLRTRKDERSVHVQELYRYAVEKLSPLPLRINQPKGSYLPYILNITLPSIKSETMLHALSADGIFVSSGSACSSHSAHPSDSLLAFGLTTEEADCSLRISLSDMNTKEELDALYLSLKKNLDTLVRIRR